MTLIAIKQWISTHPGLIQRVYIGRILHRVYIGIITNKGHAPQQHSVVTHCGLLQSPALDHRITGLISRELARKVMAIMHRISSTSLRNTIF